MKFFRELKEQFELQKQINPYRNPSPEFIKSLNPNLRGLYYESDHVLRQRAAERLGEEQNKEALFPLLAKLTNRKEHPKVRIAAALALGNIGHPTAGRFLQQATKDKIPEVSKAAKTGLNTLVKSLRLSYQDKKLLDAARTRNAEPNSEADQRAEDVDWFLGVLRKEQKKKK